jgi:hypothetical protein
MLRRDVDFVRKRNPGAASELMFDWWLTNDTLLLPRQYLAALGSR